MHYTTDDKARRQIRQDFDSWSDLLDFACNRTSPIDAAGTGWSRNNRGSLAWYGSDSWTEAVTLARDGWPEGERQIKRLSLDLFDRISSMIERPVYRYDVEGSDFDVARVVDGEPECWTREETILTEGRRIVRIVCAGFVSAGVDPDVVNARGAAVCALAELLTYAGHGVQIDLCFAGSGHNGGHSEAWVTLKAPEQPLDLPRLAFALAHPSSFRRIMFAIGEGWPEWAREIFGIPAYYWSTAEPDDKGDLFIAPADLFRRWVSDPTTARAWVVSTLKTQGVHLRETDEQAETPAAAPQPHTVSVPYVPRYSPRRRRRRW